MTKTKRTRSALISSVVSLFLCFTMLLGTTYAWFTDSVTSANNKIVSGKLDVDLYLWSSETKAVKITEESAPIFGANSLVAQNNAADTLWEPGKTQVVYLSIKNNGSLALKYKVAIEVTDVQKNITDVLEYTITPNEKWSATPVAWAGNGESVVEGTNVATSDVVLGAEKEHFFALSVHMDENAGNDYQDGSVTFDISILATQLASENDSFNNQYDADAEYPVIYDHKVNDFAGLKAAFAEGGNIILTENIAMDELLYVEQNANVYLDMNGKTMAAGNNIDPESGFLWIEEGSSLTIDGNGTFDLGTNPGLSLIIPKGEVIIENGTFIRKVPAGTDPGAVGAMFVGTKTGKLVINGGYFDGGYYDANAELAFNGGFTETATDIEKRGQAGDTNKVRVALKNNVIKNLNLTAENVTVYGGTFVGVNPAWGDEGCAMPITPNYLRPWSYYQGTFLEGQKTYDDRIEIPVNYSITESKTSDGRPVYTVTYKYEKVATADDVANAIASGKNVVLTEDINVTDTLNVSTPVKIDLNGRTLTVSRMEANSTLTVNGGTLVNGEATYPAISVNNGGKLVLNDVSVIGGAPCNILTSGTAQAAEIVGVQVFGGECVLNNCDIYLDVTEPRFSNSVFAIGIHGGSLTMNGGSITVKSVGSTKEQYDYQSAIFAGENTDKTVTLNNVDVTAKNFLYAWGGTTTVNTTADDGAYTGFDVKNGGTYTVNYNNDN